MLIALGLADETNPGVWNDIQSAFAESDNTYLGVMGPGLERLRIPRRIGLYAAGRASPYLVVVIGSYLQSMGIPGDDY